MASVVFLCTSFSLTATREYIHLFGGGIQAVL